MNYDVESHDRVSSRDRVNAMKSRCRFAVIYFTAILSLLLFIANHLIDFKIKLDRPVGQSLIENKPDGNVKYGDDDENFDVEQYIWKPGKSVLSLIGQGLETNTLTTRIERFNDAITSIRSRTVPSHLIRGAKNEGEWLTIATAATNFELIRGDADNFMEQLSFFPQVTTLLLPWTVRTGVGLRHRDVEPVTWDSLNDFENLLTQNYFRWTGDKALCSYVDNPDEKFINYPVTGDTNCTMNIDQFISTATSLEVAYLRWPHARADLGRSRYRFADDVVKFRQDDQFYHVTPSSLLYLHIITADSIVTSVGDVITSSFKFVPDGCVAAYDRDIPEVSRIVAAPVFNELFVISQFWGSTVFHRMVEIMPRLAPFVKFLLGNPQIRIHGPETGGRLAELVSVLGLDPSRLVSGEVVARTIYLPPVTQCGRAGIQQVQLLSDIYRRYIEKNFPTPFTEDKNTKLKLVLIRRSGVRFLMRHSAIENVVRAAADDYGLEFAHFIDNPSPSLNQTMKMFYSAVMVVGPHGAGESNMIFARPGLYVIEGACYNLCLKHTSHVLGHRWHGLRSAGGCHHGFVDIHPKRLDFAIRRHLDAWKQTVASLSSSSSSSSQSSAAAA